MHSSRHSHEPQSHYRVFSICVTSVDITSTHSVTALYQVQFHQLGAPLGLEIDVASEPSKALHSFLIVSYCNCRFPYPLPFLQISNGFRILSASNWIAITVLINIIVLRLDVPGCVLQIASLFLLLLLFNQCSLCRSSVCCLDTLRGTLHFQT